MFPGLSLDRIEAMTIVEIGLWHERAVVRKSADLEAAGSTAQMIGALFASRTN